MTERRAEIIKRVRRAAGVLLRRFDVEKVYLFGSQLTVGRNEWSDVDIGVFLRSFAGIKLRDRIRAVVEIQRDFGDDLEFHFFDASDAANRESVSFAAEVRRTVVEVKID